MYIIYGYRFALDRRRHRRRRRRRRHYPSIRPSMLLSSLRYRPSFLLSVLPSFLPCSVFPRFFFRRGEKEALFLPSSPPTPPPRRADAPLARHGTPPERPSVSVRLSRLALSRPLRVSLSLPPSAASTGGGVSDGTLRQHGLRNELRQLCHEGKGEEEESCEKGQTYSLRHPLSRLVLLSLLSDVLLTNEEYSFQLFVVVSNKYSV